MRRLTTIFIVIAAMIISAGAALASGATLTPFTQDELDSNWEADRLYPSGDVDSVSFEGRDNVARLAMDSAQASDDGSWWGYEGIKKVDDHGTAIQVDLYVPSDWQGIPVNAGFWASDAVQTEDDRSYPIIAYRNMDSVEAGFYVWDGDWVAVSPTVDYDAWNTLGMTLDSEAGVVSYTINGEAAGSVSVSGDHFDQVFLNQYNFGAFDPDNAVDYDVHWHAGLTLDSKDQCKKGNWETLGFKNQGQCIKFVETGKDSR